jgi:hypothetical protein
MEDNLAQTNSNSTNSLPVTKQETVIPQKYVILGIIVAVLALAVIIILMVLAVRNPLHTETFRDIAIIALAAESGLIGLALIVLIVQVARLINMLEFEIKPIIIHTSKTASTVRGTATFMSEHVVSPMIKASGYATGLASLARSIKSIIGLGQGGNSKEHSQPIDSEDKGDRS